MRALVVYCHPVPESFCAAVRDAVVETIAARGCEARLIDLYAEGFNPVLSADERRHYNDRAPSDPALAEHIAHLRSGRDDRLRLPDLVVRPAGDAEGLARPGVGAGGRLQARGGGHDRAADGPHLACRGGDDMRGALVVVASRRPSRAKDASQRRSHNLRAALPHAFLGALPDGHVDAIVPLGFFDQGQTAPRPLRLGAIPSKKRRAVLRPEFPQKQ